MKTFQAHIIKKALGLESFKMFQDSYKAVNPRLRENHFMPNMDTIHLLRDYLSGDKNYKEVRDEIKQGSANIYYTLLQTARWMYQEGFLTLQKPKRTGKR